MVPPRAEEQALISSITSAEFRKVVFVSSLSLFWGFQLTNPHWVPFDDIICGLADRLRASGSRHTLEVELRLASVGFPEEDLKQFLPKFKEKGRIRIVGVRFGGVQEWP
jgi:hypothetical protein